MAVKDQYALVQKLYVAFYQRPADPAGLEYWSQRIDAAGGNATETINAFANSAESQGLYGAITGDTVGTVIDQVYQALFGVAPDPAGRDFYINGFKAGTFNAGTLALDILNGARNDDAVAINNKLNVANQFTQQVDGRAFADASFGFGTSFAVTYAGDADAVAARAFLTSVTSNPATVLDTNGVKSALQTQIADAGDPILAEQAVAKTFTLTAGVDSGAAFTGGAGDDTFNGALNVNNQQTVNTSDSLTGGTGTDTLFATLNVNGQNLSPTMAGIENVVATTTTAGVFNFANATGVTSVTNQNSSDTLAISNIATTVAVTAANTANNDTTVVYRNVTGTADAATITLNNVTSTNLGGAGTRSDITAAGIETLTLNTTGAASQVNVVASEATRLNVTGTADLTVAGNAATVVVDASTFGGALTVTGQTVTGGAGNDAITGGASASESLSGGAGNDTITFASNFTNADTVAGGDGTADTLRLGTAADATGYTTPATRTVSGIEILRVDAALGADLTLSNIQAGIQQVRLTAGTGANRNITFDTAVAGTVRLDAAADGQIALTTAGTGTTDSLTITNGAAAVSGASIDVFAGQIIGATGVESLVLNGSGNGTATTQTVAAITVTGTGTATTTLNFVGSNAFVVANGSALTATTIDAAGLTGNATLNMGNTAAATATTINGSNNNSTGATPTGDVLLGRATASTTINANGGNDNVTGGTAADTLNGGDGNDTISGAGGNDVITGGAGNDQITIGAGNVSVDGGAGNDNVIVTGVNSADTLMGGADTDTLSIAAALSAGDAVNISGFEIINASAAVLQDLVALTNSGNNTITTLGVSATTGTTSFSNAGAITDLNITADDNSGSIAMTRLLDNTSNAINLNLRGATGNNNSTYAAIALADEESITIASGQAPATFSNTNDNIITTLTAGDLTSLTVNGANDLTIGTLAAATGLATVNLQSSTGIVNINAASSTSALTLTSGSGTRSQTNFTSGSGNDNLTGTANDDTLIGGAGNDIINAGNGANSLEGGTGADTINGGTGVDTVTVAMQVNGTHGADRVNLGAGLDVVNVTFAGTNQVRLTFTSADVGNGDALDGNNTAASTGIAYGGAEDGGLAVRFEQELSDVVTGEAGAAGTTVVARYDDEGVAFVSATNTAAFDVRDLGTGTARGSFVNVVLGTDGNDSFTATSFAGGAANKSVYINAGAGDDNLTGSSVADFLVGGAGADVLTGGAGADSLLGGAGADKFVIGAADTGITVANADRIIDFKVSGADTLALGAAGTATNFTFNGTAVADFAAALVAADAAFAADVGGAKTYYVANDGTNTYVFIDQGGDGAAAENVVVLTGVVTVNFADIVAS